MQTLEMLLAVHVHNLAADLRSSARARFYAGVFDRMSEDERHRMLAAWERENPIARFIPVALEEVEQTAGQIQELMRGR